MMLRVAYLPRDVVEPERKVCVVVDVLRATSTLVTLLQAGCQEIRLEPTVPEARAAGAGQLLVGEEGGIKPPGFDYGNSPAEFAALDLRGRSVTFATTNGTKALQIARRSPLVLAGSLLNGPAVTALAFAGAAARNLDLQIVCSGARHGTSFSLDDAFCAGYLVELLVDSGPFALHPPGDKLSPATSAGPGAGASTHYLHDSAVAALRLYRSYRAQQPTTEQAALAAFAESRSGRGLVGLGLGADVAYCAQPGISTIVPRAVVDGAGSPDAKIRVIDAS